MDMIIGLKHLTNMSNNCKKHIPTYKIEESSPRDIIMSCDPCTEDISAIFIQTLVCGNCGLELTEQILEAQRPKYNNTLWDPEAYKQEEAKRLEEHKNKYKPGTVMIARNPITKTGRVCIIKSYCRYSEAFGGHQWTVEYPDGGIGTESECNLEK